MARRLTITSAEMGNLPERPDLNLPVGGEATPIKKEVFWPKPSKWQICMPRLRSVLNAVVGLAALALVVKVLSQGPPKSREHIPIHPSQPPENPEQNFREPTEAEMIERSKREDWVWKDYDLCVASSARSGQMLISTLVTTVSHEVLLTSRHALLKIPAVLNLLRSSFDTTGISTCRKMYPTLFRASGREVFP
jgi:hypothetical protein